MADSKRPRSREKFVTHDSKGIARRGDTFQGNPSQGSAGGSHRGAMIGGGLSIPVVIIMIIYYLLSGDVDPAANLYQTDSTQWETTTEAKLNEEVAEGSRSKYTNIIGNGEDIITLMIYMCGTDLESRNGMATSDISEMLAADISDKVNVLIYTGGCLRWQNNTVSNSVNQIYQVKNGSLKCLVEDDGAGTMVAPETLASFINWGAKNFPANRYELIFWDHGGGSVSGYGYDEKFKNSGSMTLSWIKSALNKGGVKFDFIGFDACLMATAETALALDEHGDYLIASEETEPGIGWYYTNWLGEMSKDTSMPTTRIGKLIIDDYTQVCARKAAGQKTTLSLVDLAEFSNTIPARLSAFATDVSNKVSSDYSRVSNARYHSREFAQSSHIDQVDLVNLASNMESEQGESLADAIRDAVKYNRTSGNMTNAYGVSIYFPQQRKDYVQKAASEYQDIGMDEEYADCIRAFADVQSSGQTMSTAQDIMTVFNLLTAGRNGEPEGDDGSSIDASKLVWEEDSQGRYRLSLSDDDWEKILALDLVMYYDDGEGYYDLGNDNLFEFDDEGRLMAADDRTWIAINGQPVAYYHTDTTEEGDEYSITGYVPVRLNGDKASLILVFDNDNPRGYIAGAVYEEEETDTVAKSLTKIRPGDKLDFLCNYYSYDGDYEKDVVLGEEMTVTDSMTISNTDVGSGKVKIMYRFTDIYQQHYWTQSLEM